MTVFDDGVYMLHIPVPISNVSGVLFTGVFPPELGAMTDMRFIYLDFNGNTVQIL